MNPLVTTGVQIDAIDPMRLAYFWSKVFGIPMQPGSNGNLAMLAASNCAPGLIFHKTPEPKLWRNRLALRLVADDMGAHLSRLLTFGAKGIGTRTNRDGSQEVILVDPEGNEFILISRAV